MSRPHRFLFLLPVVAALAWLATAHAGLATVVDVTLTDPVSTDWGVAPIPTSVATAGDVQFEVTIDGGIQHDFHAIDTDLPAAGLPVDGGTNTVDLAQQTVAGSIPTFLPADGTQSLTVTLADGHYALICNLPGHYAGGMSADFQVGPVQQPSTATPTATQLPGVEPTATPGAPAATPTPSGVVGLAETGAGPGGGASTSWWLLAGVAVAAAAFSGAGALAYRRSR